MILKKTIKGMLPDVKSTEMPEGIGYLIHNMRHKNGRLSPADNMFKHLILRASDYISSATQALADSGDAAAIALINSTPLGGKTPIYAFLADGKLVVINEAQRLFISNINGSIREGEYTPFENTGGSAARFNRIPYISTSNEGDPLPQNLLECQGFIPTKKLVGKTLYIGGVGHVCQGVYSVGVGGNTKWLLKLEGFIPSGSQTYPVYEKKRVVNAYTASEYEYATDYGAMEINGELWMTAFNKSRKKNDIQQCLCFINGKPASGVVYCALAPTPMAVLNTMGVFPRSQYHILFDGFSGEAVKQYCWSGRRREHSVGPYDSEQIYIAVRFNKPAMPSKNSDGSYKWRAAASSLCWRNHSSTFGDSYSYKEHYLPFQGIEEGDEYVIFPAIFARINNSFQIYNYQRGLSTQRSVTVLTCGSGEWYSASDTMITVEGLTLEHPVLLPDDTALAVTDDAYPQWGIIADGSPSVADGTTLYSGRLGLVTAFNGATISSEPAFINSADHTVVVNPKTFSQAIVLTTKAGLVTFTPGTSSYGNIMNAPGAKFCAYFNNLLIIANTVELDWVEQDGSAYDVNVTGYTRGGTGTVTLNGQTIAFADHEVILSGQMADHMWVESGKQVWFKGYGVPEAFDGIACMIKYVRNIDATHFGVLLRHIVSDTTLDTIGYTPSGVIMKPSVRSEKVYEQTVRASDLNSFMDFSSDEDADTSKAYQLFGSFTPIAGLAVLNNMLYVFKRDSITEASYTGNANAPLSFEEDKYKFGGYNATTVRDKIFYYHPTKGICVFDGMREAVISDGISSVFASGEWIFVPYLDSAVAVIPASGDAKHFYVYDEGAWSRVDGGRIIPVFNAPELEYLEITDSGVYYCSMPKTVRETGYNWRVSAYFPAGNTSAVFAPTPLAFSPGSYAAGNIALEAPESFAAIPLDGEKKDLAKRIKAITFDGMAGAADGQRVVTCRVESTHDRASNEPAAGDQAITDAFFDGKSECKIYPNVVGRDPFCVIRAQRIVPTAVSTDTSLFANWVDETSISVVNIDIESSGENPRR